MSYLSLYRKWRPQTFDEIAGQSHVSQTLKNAIDRERVSHAYLFCGPRGTGKTSTARILAKAINCASGPTSSPCNKCESCLSIGEGRSVDVLELDAASNRGVEEIRELLRRIPYSSTQGGKKVYIIDEVHMLTPESFNTLLKTLEEPPDHVIFVLATTEPHKVLPTILSRCQRFDFRRISLPEIEKRLKEVAKAEKIDIEASALSIIADHAQGALRDALGILDQLASYSKGKIKASDVVSLLGLTDGELLLNFTDILKRYDLAEGLLFIDGLIEKGFDIRQFIQDLLKHLRNLFLIQTVSEAKLGGIADELREKYLEQALSINARTLAFFINVLNDVYNQSRWATDVRLLLEIALFKMLKFSDDISIEGIIHRVERIENMILNGVSLPSVGGKPEAEKTARKITKKEESPTDKSPATSPKEKPGVVEASMGDVAGLGNIPFDIESVTKAWPQVLRVIKEKKRTRYGFFESAKPNRVEDGRLVLSLKESARDFVESPEGIKLLQSALKMVTGRDIPVICEQAKRGTRTVTVAETGETEEGLMPADDYIKLVQDAFGAKIVEEISVEEI